MTETSRYDVPAGITRVEETIDRSRFITTIGHAPTVGDARAFVAGLREEFRDATHNCWAFVVGPPGDTSRVGMSDDGEPHGTAGHPMLNVLLHSGVGDVVAVVTRYYGGTKLGRGGLVRAYGGGVKRALERLPRRELVSTTTLDVAVDYAAADAVRRSLPQYEAESLTVEFAECVAIRVRLPDEQVGAFREALAAMTNGGASVRRIEIEDEQTHDPHRGDGE